MKNPLLKRLKPERIREVPVLKDEERLRLFASVQDHDPCLKAVLDRLEETLEGEFMVAIDPRRSDNEKLRACEGLRVAYYDLQFIESARQEARAWLERQNAEARKAG